METHHLCTYRNTTVIPGQYNTKCSQVNLALKEIKHEHIINRIMNLLDQQHTNKCTQSRRSEIWQKELLRNANT